MQCLVWTCPFSTAGIPLVASRPSGIGTMHAWVQRGGQASTSGHSVVSPGRDARCWSQFRSRRRHYHRYREQPKRDAFTGGSDRGSLSSADEYSFSLTQYMVVLDKPIGLTLAPDPSTGHVYVQHVQQGMSAADSKLVLVGDRLLSCSAVFGDEMWHAADLQRTRWAINNRPGKVKLVLERSTGGPLPPWYFRGREGIATWEVPELQLPVQFITPVGGELAESLPGVGKSLSVSFNRCMNPSAAEHVKRPFLRPGLKARHARTEQLTQQLSAAAAAPVVDISLPFGRLMSGNQGGARLQVNVSPTPVQADGASTVLPFRRSNNSNSVNNNSSNNSNSSSSSSPLGGNSTGSIPSNNTNSSSSSSEAAAGSSSSSNGGSKQGSGAPSHAAAAAAAAAAWGGTAAAAAAAVKEKKVVQVLPWILVSNARLNLMELTRIATTRALGSLLELGLVTNHDGLLCPPGSQLPPFSLPAAPVPPTLSPSDFPKPAPVDPPPMPTQSPPDEEQQQQQQGEGNLAAAAAAAAAAGDEPGTVAAGLAGIAGPDTCFAAAAAAAAAVAGQEQQPGAAAVDSSSNVGSDRQQQQQQQQIMLDPGQPSQITLQAHAVLHCLADLHRLAVRCKWTPLARESWRSSNSNSSSMSGMPPYISPTYTSQGGIAGQGLAAAGFSSSSSSSNGPGHPYQQQQQQWPSSCQLLIHCDESSWHLVGLLLVSWLHWCCGVEESAAVESVSQSLGVTLDTAILLEVRRLLVFRAKERFSRLMLTWPYGGLSAEVSGELVGGWTERVAMKRCLKPDGCLGASQGHFYLELKGLHPGKYHYKYIIDNTWATDDHQPQALDSQGNWNNVLEVKPPPRIETPEEQAHFAALQALCMAFERKLRPVGSFFGS